MPQQGVALDMNNAKAVVKRHCAVAWKRELNHPAAIRLLRDGIVPPEKELSRRERVYLSQLRCGGHCPLLRSYLFRIGVADSSTCQDCLEDREDTAAHLFLQCPAHTAARIQILGPSPTMSVLADAPAAAVAYLRRTRRL